jgi:signal transduction histidine kinase
VAPPPAPSSELADRALRLAAAGAVGASVVHELRNALAVVSSSLYLARRDRHDEGRLVAHLDKAAREVNRAQAVVSAVLGLARGEALQREVTPVAALVDAARGAVVLPTNVTLSVRLAPPDLAVLGDPVLLERLLSNLLLNAIEALAGRGRGAIEVRASACAGGVELAVEDDGPGVDPAIAAHMFDPLVTTKAHGTGLGLALVRTVARAHGGEAAAGPRDGRPGTRVVVHIPGV